jgi:regulator of sirC expression with transglutaminase-like and TPR domain
MNPLLSNEASSTHPATERELHSLLSLLDDPDIAVATVVEERIRSHGQYVIEPLTSFLGTCQDQLAIERASGILRDLTTDALSEEFTQLRNLMKVKPMTGLEHGVFLIARYGYPSLDINYYKRELDSLAGMLYDRIKGIHSPIDLLSATNDFFFKEKKFRGNHQHFLEADNSYINQVIDRRLGIPISLSVLYLLVAGKRLHLPFSGASTPGHFLIRFDGIRDEPLFIDAFNGGIILRSEDIRRFLYTSGIPYYESFISPAQPRNILLRMLRNLMILFEEQKDHEAHHTVERFHSILFGAEECSDTDVL